MSWENEPSPTKPLGDSLNRIVHPCLVERLWFEVQQTVERDPRKIVVVDAALIFEWGELERFDEIIVVQADEELGVERVASRLRLSQEEVRRRLSFQMSVQKKIAGADFCNR